MRILLTGSNGFLGKHILTKLISTNEIYTLSKTNAQIICDLSITKPNLPLVELVIHSAGKAHVIPRTKIEENDFFNVNVIGTKNLLKSIEDLEILPKYFVFISSVSVYGLESGYNISENSPLNASDPYGKSKIECEKLIIEWCRLHNIIFTILRLPLIIGADSKGNLSSMINGIKKGYYFNINGGNSKKSMVLATDIAGTIEQAAFTGGIYNLTDGHHPSFNELSSKIALHFGKKKPFNIPYFIAYILAWIGDHFGTIFPFNSRLFNKINSTLTFDDSKARYEFQWAPNLVLENLKNIL